jgi:RNA polymerase sigma factor (sigma-70 family)
MVTTHAAVPSPVSQPSAVPAAAAQRQRAFEALFQAEYARVVVIARRITQDTGEAEDVAQEVFLQLHRRQDPRAPYAAAWLHAASAHTALNAIRSRRRRQGREQRWSVDTIPAPDPADEAVTADARRRVRTALTRVRRRHAEVLALRYGGLSYSEVADALGVRVSHVGTLLRRAEAALRKEIGDAPL